MTKKQLICTIASCLMGLTGLQAQNFSLGVRGGISVPDLAASGSEQNPLNSGYTSRLGPDFGIFGQYAICGLFSIQADLEYSSQGGKKDGMQAMPLPAQFAQEFPEGEAPTYVYANFNSQAELNYFMLPVLARFSWMLGSASPLSFYVDAGPFLGILLSANQVTSGSSNIYSDPKGQEPLTQSPQSFNGTNNIKSQLNTVNFGAEASIGLQYAFGPSDIFLDAGGNYGFLNIQKGTQNGKNTTGAATLLVGYIYHFGH